MNKQMTIKLFETGEHKEISEPTAHNIYIFNTETPNQWYSLHFNNDGQLVIEGSESIKILPDASNHITLEFRRWWLQS